MPGENGPTSLEIISQTAEDASAHGETQTLIYIVKKIEELKEMKRQKVDSSDCLPVIVDMVDAIRDAKTKRPGSPIGQYQMYLSRIDKEELESTIISFLSENPNDQFLSYLFEACPFVGLSAHHIHQELQKAQLEFLDKRPVKEWFEKSLADARETHVLINQFFTQWQSLADPNDHLAIEFLDAWKRDMELIVAEVINLACGFAIHVQTEDCATLSGVTPFSIRDEQELSPLKSTLLSLPNQSPVFGERYYEHLKSEDKVEKTEQVGKGKNKHTEHILYFPTPIHARDIVDFLDFYKSYWRELNNNFNPPLRASQEDKKSDKETYLPLKGFAKIQLRSQPTEYAQARVAILPQTTRFSAFDVRIDKGRRHLGLDIAGVNPHDAIKYIEDIVSSSKGKDVVQEYSNWTQRDGSFKARPARENGYLPSIMRPGNIREPNIIARRASLFVAVASHIGSQLGIRQNNPFSYHLKGEVSQSPIFHNNFQQIVESLGKMLT